MNQVLLVWLRRRVRRRRSGWVIGGIAVGIPLVAMGVLAGNATLQQLQQWQQCQQASASGLSSLGQSPGSVTVTGRVSTFGPPGEPANATASGNPGGDAVSGISLHVPGTHYSDHANVVLMGHWFRVTIGGHQAILKDIDLGPADYLDRAIDVTGAGARAMGIDPANFPTDSVGQAVELRGGAGSLLVSTTMPQQQCVLAAAAGPGQYVNPFAHSMAGLVSQRVDMGVDYDNVQGAEIDAIGRARITAAGTGIGGNWVCGGGPNGGVYYKLLDGPDAGRSVYVTEDVVPTVHAGDVVAAGQKIAIFSGGSLCIEIGWGSGTPWGTEATPLGQVDTTATYCGRLMSNLIQSLGGKPGVFNQPPGGSSCPAM